MNGFLSTFSLFNDLIFRFNLIFLSNCILKEEKLRGRPGYEHLNDPLHILIEADLPANVVDMRLRQAQEIIEELLKPVVFTPLFFFMLL